MAVITIFSASYCQGDEVAVEVARRLGYVCVDKEVLDWASQEFDVSVSKLVRAMRGAASVFDKFSSERERCIAYIKAAIGEKLKRDNVVYHGFAGHLLPRDITHVLRVCLVANRDHRVALAVEREGMTKRAAHRMMKRDDDNRRRWTEFLFNSGPWDKRLYDIKIPMHATSVEDAVGMICENVRKEALATTLESRKAMEDFLLEARVNIAFVEQGHDVEVSAVDGDITVLIKEHVLRVERLKQELKEIADGVPGVTTTEVRLGPKVKRPTVFEFEMPSKVLLVDDEQEFVQTLSERLQMRELDTAVVYNGEEALSYIEGEEPEVMILDLRMPGIDGVEVLRRVKKTHPDVEVIILTGHGTEKDAALTRELGAFAYLEKPVAIDTLAKTVREAYEKIRRKKAERQDGAE